MPSVSKVIDVSTILTPDSMASHISKLWVEWKGARATWENEKRELRQYIFATDTTKTTNARLPWKNTTTLPKICQIRDNLHANYMAALFPTEDWFTWLAQDRDSATMEKRRKIISYMKNKLAISGFRETVSQLILDYIDYGNAFAEVVYVNETHTTPDGITSTIYSGPRLCRISPFDIVFDITAPSFKQAPKITRSLLNMGQLRKLMATQPNQEHIKFIFDKMKEVRQALTVPGGLTQFKWDSISIDGFGSPYAYFCSGMVELLHFEGDVYDVNTGTLLENQDIIVVDRSYVILQQPYKSWLGQSNKEHVGWRTRPDNIMAMGPLDNLVGCQYRVDHLENLKADVFDQIAHPVVYQRGYVEDWEWGPGERIFGDAESAVEVLRPDSAALNADFQIDHYVRQMEEFAGAPKQAMGIRTPGEKTAYEVQALENAAGRIFQHKVGRFEEVFLEPLMNQMLEAGRRNLDIADQIRIQDTDIGVVEFLAITKDDITAKGKLVPRGARHFARQNQIVQNLAGFMASPAYADQAVSVHLSGKAIAKLFEEVLNVEPYGLYKENIRVFESAETQQLSLTAQEEVMKTQGVNPDLDGLSEGELSGFQDQANQAPEQAAQPGPPR